MAEKEALRVAIENVEAAMSALDSFPQESYAADEAFDALDQALQVLEAGLACCDGTDDVNALVSLQREPGAAPEQSTDPGHPQGEGEGSPDSLIDGRPLHALLTGPHPSDGLPHEGRW